jgi:hypothetical protein
MMESLETRVSQLENELQILRRQMEDSLPAKKKALPKTATTAPEGFTYLSDFCTQHFVPYHAAEELFPHMIRGQPITVAIRINLRIVELRKAPDEVIE